MTPEREEKVQGYKWWLEKVFVPLFGAGGFVAIMVAIITNSSSVVEPSPTPIPTPVIYQLTHNLYVNVAPSFSPDGQNIVFLSNRDGNFEIYSMRRDGSHQRRLTYAPEIHPDVPSFSPDGNSIIFGGTRYGNEDVYMMKSDGDNVRNLTRSSDAGDGRPRFSPSGQYVVFDSNRTGNWEIYIARLEGDDLEEIQQLTFRRDYWSRLPSITPLGDSVIFRSRLINYAGLPDTTAPDSGIFSMRLDGTNLRRLSGDHTDWYPTITFKNWIAFVSDRDGNEEIYLMDLNGENVKRLTNNIARDGYPSISPDGKWLAFSSERANGSFNIFIMSLDHVNP